jgi:hypothetical protein
VLPDPVRLEQTAHRQHSPSVSKGSPAAQGIMLGGLEALGADCAVPTLAARSPVADRPKLDDSA